MPAIVDLPALASDLRALRSVGSSDRSLLVGLSGIDGSGKGFLTAALSRELEQSDLRVALLNVDGWLNLPAIRFSPRDPAERYYVRHETRHVLCAVSHHGSGRSEPSVIEARRRSVDRPTHPANRATRRGRTSERGRI